MTRHLTEKQAAFAAAIIEGASPLEAYRAAGYSQNMSAHAQSVEAGRLLAHPDISLMVEDAQAEAAKNAEWSREIALERLFDVNTASYTRLKEHGISKDATVALRAFIETADRLNEMTNEGAASMPAPMFYWNPEEREQDQRPVLYLGVEPKRYEGDDNDEEKQIR